MGKMVESIVVEFDQAKYEEFLSFGSKSPRARQYCKVSSGTRSQVSSETPTDATDKKSVTADHITRDSRVNVSHETCKVDVADVQPVHTRPLPQLQVPGGPSNPYGVTGILNVDRDDTRDNCKRNKLEQSSVQQRQNARLRLASLLNCVRRTEFTYGDPNPKPNGLAFP